MEISPEGKDSIRSALCQFMSEDDAERFMDLEYAMDVIKQGQLCWQAPVSIGIHAAELYLNPKADNDTALLPNLIGLCLEPLEVLLKLLLPKADKKTLEDERARMLFHTRCALGFLLLAKGEKQRAKTLLHEVAATQVSYRGTEIRLGGGILSCTHDVAEGKWHAALYLLLEWVRQKDKNYEELLYAITEAAACMPKDTFITIAGLAILGVWTTECEKTDASQEYDFPDFAWRELFAGAAELLSFCQEADSAGDLPNKCEEHSPQFVAWKFGQIIGRFAAQDPRWGENPLEKTSGFNDVEGDIDFPSPWGEEPTYRALRTVEALLCEFDVHRDWRSARQRYVEMWQRSYTYKGAALSEITPESDLYWAMRIGFADKILELPEQQALVPIGISPQSVVPNSGSLTIGEITSLRLQKLQLQSEEILQRLPAGTRDIHAMLQEKLGPLLTELPTNVVNTLVKAEKYYRTDVDDDNAKVWFYKAVEASFKHCLVEPLADWLEKRDDKRITICFPRGSGQKSPGQLRKLQLWEWADVLETLSAPHRKDFSSLGTPLREFTTAHLGWSSRMPDLRPLSDSLRKVNKYRGGSAHHQEASSRYDRERLELEQMRNLVLGTGGQPSLIAQIFQYLRK